MDKLEGLLTKYADREISTERLAEEIGVNYYVLHSALRQGCSLFEPLIRADERERVLKEMGFNK